MEFELIIEQAMSVRRSYQEFEQHHFGSTWSPEELALGFVGDVGDLAKLVMAENGRRIMKDTHRRLAHELADCLWSIIVLARAHNIDLESAFLATMAELEAQLRVNNEG